MNRLDRAKRIDLLLEAASADPAVRVVIAGDGPDRERLESLAKSTGLNGRVEFRGTRLRRGARRALRRCRAVYYAPIDEDFGMVPYEAFLAEKPVLTTTDAGGPLEIVHDHETGLVAEPDVGRARAGVLRTRRGRGRGARVGKAGRASRSRHVGPRDRPRPGVRMTAEIERSVYVRFPAEAAAGSGAPRTIPGPDWVSRRT